MTTKRTLILGTIALLIVFGGIVFAASAGANNGNECNNGVHTYNPHCASPTPHPSPTPTPKPSASPSASPCLILDLKEWQVPIPCPSPSASPSASPSPQPQTDNNVSDGRSSNPDATKAPDNECRGANPGNATGLSAIRLSPTSIRISWNPSVNVIDNQLVQYGYSSNNLEFGVPNLAANASQVDLNSLKENAVIFFRVGSEKAFCTQWSNVIDP